MASSLVLNYIHIVFSTRNRRNWIDSSIEDELHNYMGGICQKLGCHPLRVGGTSNHVHILCQLSKNMPLSKLVEEIKSHSSKWIKSKESKYLKFYWQKGYGAFSVNYNRTDIVVNYIKNQRQHHRIKSFEKEYKELLIKEGIEFDEGYLYG